MIDLVKKFFGKAVNGRVAEDEEKATHDIGVATCALFLEMSQIDGKFSASEREHIMSVLTNDYGLSDDVAAALLEAAREKLDESIDLWRFTNLINQNYSREEKRRIIETVWRIAYADGKLEKHEDYLAHKLAHLLRLTQEELIEAKLKAKQGHPLKPARYQKGTCT